MGVINLKLVELGGAKVQTVPPANASSGELLRAGGRVGVSQVLRLPRTRNHFKAIPVLKRRNMCTN